MKNSKWVYYISLVIFFIYLFLSIYEVYVSELIGNISRPYLVLFVVFMFLNIRMRSVTVDQTILFIWLLFYCLSLLWTTNIGQASLYIATIIIMSSIAILCGNCYFSKNFVDTIVAFYKWCSISLAFLGVFYSEPISVDNSVRMVLTIGGVQPDPNNLVALYTIGSGLALCSLQKDSKHKVVNLLGLFLCVYSILITGSRSGILILGVQFLIWIFYINRGTGVVMKTLLGLSLILGIGYIFYNFIDIETMERLLGLGDLEFTDSTGRKDMWQVALEHFCSSPIVGNGWGSYPAHNTFLTILADIGLVGLGLIILYLSRLYVRILKYNDYYALMIFVSGMIQSFLLDAQNKRFFWNIIILSVLIINSYADSTRNLTCTSKTSINNQV